MVKYFLNKPNNTKDKGTVNELLIAGNLIRYKFKVNVNEDNNPNYDLTINKGNKTSYVECKLDNRSHITGNFYFELWSCTFNRYTGVLNNDMNTVYSHTYCINGEYYALIGKRKLFYEALKQLKPYIKHYNNTYKINGKLKGDKAVIINKKLFIKHFKGYNIKLKPKFAWFN